VVSFDIIPDILAGESTAVFGFGFGALAGFLSASDTPSTSDNHRPWYAPTTHCLQMNIWNRTYPALFPAEQSTKEPKQPLPSGRGLPFCNVSLNAGEQVGPFHFLTGD